MAAGGGTGHNLSNLLRNSRRKQRKAYDGWRESDQESQGIKIKPISNETIKAIRNKLKKQRKEVIRKYIVTMLVLVITTVCLISLVTF